MVFGASHHIGKKEFLCIQKFMLKLQTSVIGVVLSVAGTDARSG